MAKKKSYKSRYTKTQIMRNRFIVILFFTVIFLLAIFGVVKVVEAVFSGDTQAVMASSTTSQSSQQTTDDSIAESEDDSQDIEDSSVVSGSISNSEVDDEMDDSTSGDDNSTSEVDMTYPGDGTPLLVNKQNPIPEGYDPSLESIGDFYFREDGIEALEDMIAAAADDGITLSIISAYRSNERQTSNYNARVDQYISEGKTETQAKELTEMFIAPPGTSEHTLGLAVDFNSLYQSFEDTKEYEWLIENCAEFGFILRYPKDKVAVTGFSFEPWHYRFVGTNHSIEIMERGVCLEEYLLS